MVRTFFLFVLCFLFSLQVYAEIIYLNDGQVLKGSIVKEEKEFIVIKTRFQERKVYRNNITRIMYGARDMEPVFFLMKDGTLLKGFLVDQDNVKVIYRKSEDSPDELTLLKEDISQMSSEEITPLYPYIIIRLGIYTPLNSGGANLDSGRMISAGYGFNFNYLPGSHLLLESGYVRCGSKTNNDQSFMIVPVTVNGMYFFPLKGLDIKFLEMIQIAPKAGFGIAVVEFDDGEGSSYRGYDFFSSAGTGVLYEFGERYISIGLWAEYSLLYEKKTMLHGLSLSGVVQYYF